MLQSTETVADQYYARVDEETDEDSRRYDFQVGTFGLVQVPFSTDTQESSVVTASVDDQHRKIQNLKITQFDENIVTGLVISFDQS